MYLKKCLNGLNSAAILVAMLQGVRFVCCTYGRRSVGKDIKGVVVAYSILLLIHRRNHSLRTYVWRPWLIGCMKLGYSFNVHA